MYKSNSCCCYFSSRDSHFRTSGRGFSGMGFSIPTKSGENGGHHIFLNITAQQALCKLFVALAKGGEGVVNATLSLGECVRTRALFSVTSSSFGHTFIGSLWPCEDDFWISPFWGGKDLHADLKLLIQAVLSGEKEILFPPVSFSVVFGSVWLQLCISSVLHQIT